MYKIKYGKRKPRIFLIVFLYLIVFIFGACGALLFVKSYVDRIKGENQKLISNIETLRLINSENEKDKEESRKKNSFTREVWVEFVEYSGYINAGDTIDVRVVDTNGDDIKKLSEKQVVKIDKTGMQILVNEEDLNFITGIVGDLEEGTIKKVYAVKIP